MARKPSPPGRNKPPAPLYRVYIAEAVIELTSTPKPALKQWTGSVREVTAIADGGTGAGHKAQ